MKLLKSTLVASALILGTASMSYAQDAMVDKAKDVAVDKATDMAKDKAKDMAGDKAGAMVDPAMKAGEHMMMKGDSAKDAVMKAGQSEVKSYGSGAVAGEAAKSMDANDAVTAGKVMMQGGSKEDAAMAVAKDKAKDAMTDKAKSYGSGMKDKMMQGGTIKTAPSSYGSGTPAAAPAPAAPAVTINCPAGTTAQANGTCMITGNYQPSSL